MSVNYLLSDFLTRIRNGLLVSKPEISINHSNFIESIASVLKEDGWIKDYSVTVNENGTKYLSIALKYDDQDVSVINKITLISKPSKRSYVPKSKIPKVQNCPFSA